MEQCTSVGNLELLLPGRRQVKENVNRFDDQRLTALSFQVPRIAVDMSLYACAALGYAMVELLYLLMCSAGVLAFLAAAFICDLAIYAWCNTASAPSLHSPVDRFHGPSPTIAENYWTDG